ncbi:uncharacterized protein N0V89_003770 [Didymosphaeria variabile]|uniref:non-specific serine/threonine protein kinase n=1 Tax=Didymosphaeria variabile TaxID=1932322 RepID=A0A9W9CCJ6_9PLEO|nr:uncharacterized protein N0V89_003770 [Didymosphaeria variabile]KAJ4355750.1 hypothetical protein N0V89_003770 [Didymosphaeria variabile]
MNDFPNYFSNGIQNDTDFVWKEDEWAVSKVYKKGVMRMVPVDYNVWEKTSFKSIVKKIEDAEDGTTGRNPPWEVLCLHRVPDCNRIVKPIQASYKGVNGNDCHTYNLIFKEYELGDMSKWRGEKFGNKHPAKTVPEAHLWRCLVHMTQALAVVHNQTGSTQKHPGTLIHRDIKPQNILVADNGSAYPSFKLHDFGLSRVAYGREDRRGPGFSGTYIWQPPESPYINTTYADIWAVGALIHYLAFGEYLVEPMRPNWVDDLDEEDMHEVQKYRNKYSSSHNWYLALGPRIVSPINLGEVSRITKAEVMSLDKHMYKPKYSDRLNYWMMECLEFDPVERVTVERLMKEMIPEARAALLDLGGEKALTDFELVFE